MISFEFNYRLLFLAVLKEGDIRENVRAEMIRQLEELHYARSVEFMSEDGPMIHGDTMDQSELEAAIQFLTKGPPDAAPRQT